MQRFELILLACTLPIASIANHPSNTVTVTDRSYGCFHNNGGIHQLVLDGEFYRKDILNISTQEVSIVKELILHSSTNKKELLTFLGVTEEWFQQNRKLLVMNSLKPHWAKKYPTFDLLPSNIQSAIDFAYITNTILNELAEGDYVPSTTEVEFSISFPGDPGVKVSTTAERAGMLPLYITHGEKKWKTYDPNLSTALLPFSFSNSPSFIHLFKMRELGKTGWKPSEDNHDLEDILDRLLCEETYKSMQGYQSIQDSIEIIRSHSGNLINMEPLSIHLSFNVKNMSLIDKVWCWVHLTPEGNPKDSWLDIQKLIGDADLALKNHSWLLKWKTLSPNRHVELHISGGQPRVGTKSFENSTIKRIKEECNPEFMVYLRKGNGVCGTLYFNSQKESAALEDWKKSKTEPWMNDAAVPRSSRKYALVSPKGDITIK